jgi:hypothetical protein
VRIDKRGGHVEEAKGRPEREDQQKRKPIAILHEVTV